MTKLTFDEVKKVYSQFQDKNELSVGYERTYDTVYGWLTNPAELKGLGFDPTFAARVMASVAQKILAGTLKFKTGMELDQYLKTRCTKYLKRAIREGLVLTKRIAIEELNEIREAEQKALQVEIDKGQVSLQNLDKKYTILKKWKCKIRRLQWLLIIMALLLTGVTGALLHLHWSWLLFLLHGGF